MSTLPVALITGASTGIGFATAEAMARAGFDVFAAMRNPGAAPELAELARKDKLPVRVITMNVDSDASVKSGVESVLAARGRIDVLVNNAGVGGGGTVEETPLAMFRAVMETNFFGALRCTQAVLPGMRERRSGHVVNISSVAGRMAMSPQAPYAASKWALEALSETLAQEGKAFGIRVAIIEPGVIATPIFGKREHFAPSEHYAQPRRMQAMFQAAATNASLPSVVGEKIVEIVRSRSDALRHPVGAGAAEILGARAAMTDERRVAWGGAASDEEWVENLRRDFGMDVRMGASS